MSRVPSSSDASKVWEEFRTATASDERHDRDITFWFPSRSGYVLERELRELFLTAAKALRKEDARLYQLMTNSVSSRNRRTNKGLAYELFETTLVYIIFKAFLAKDKDVQWEAGYSKNRQHKVDLAVGPSGSRILFEYKWWRDNQATTLQRIEYDIWKLRKERAGQGFLVAFWWGCEGDDAGCPWTLTHDKRKVTRAYSKLHWVRKGCFFPVFLARFRTHVDCKHINHKQQFVMLAFKVL